jgi:hypothetical protein
LKCTDTFNWLLLYTVSWQYLSFSGGNLRHLIIEACIARKLIDTSVYYWPGYVSASVISFIDLPPAQKSPWVIFMEGTPFSNSLVNFLLATPAPR